MHLAMVSEPFHANNGAPLSSAANHNPIVGRGVAKIAKIRRDYVIAKGYAFNALPPRAILDVRLPQGDGVQPLAQKVEVCGF